MMPTTEAVVQQQSQERKNLEVDDTSKGGSVGPTSRGMRRSCDQCGLKRRKCNREGPCRRCREAGDKCTYSKRKWHIPGAQTRRRKEQRQQQQQRQQHQTQQQLQAPYSGQTHTDDVALPSRLCALSLKRCRLSASPATGLVGMQENVFLRDFFDCAGFLPLTTQSHIREAIVRIMTPSTPREQSARSGGRGEEGQSAPDAEGYGFQDAMRENQLPMDPSTCTFWCAAAIGALVTGAPIKSVANYCDLAKDALANSSPGLADMEIAKAWNILAYLHSFMGDSRNFHEYLALSDSFLTASIEGGSSSALPVGFAEIIRHRELAHISSGAIGSVGTGLHSAQEPVPPQLKRVMDDAELYQYMSYSFRVFEKTVYTKAHERRSKAREHRGSGKSTNEEDRSPEVHSPHNKLIPAEVTDAMVSVWGEDNLIMFEPLEEAVGRPTIRSGIGGLLINGTLFFEKATKGDLWSAAERINRCVQIVVRYPGLCRCVIGSHVIHIMLAALAAIDISGTSELYERLRDTYNTVRSPATPPVPPLEEWRGMEAICNDLHCRAVEGVISMHLPGSTAAGGNVYEGEDHNGYDGHSPICMETKRESLVFPEDEFTVSAELLSGNCGLELDVMDTCEGIPTSSRPDLEAEQWMNAVVLAPTTSIAATTAGISPLRRSCCTLEEEVGSGSDTRDKGETVGSDPVGLVAPAADAFSASPVSDEGEGEDVHDGGIASADWLDVALLLSDAVLVG